MVPKEVKHIPPTEVLGTSGTGKTMEPWHEGLITHSSPVDGGNNVEHTHYDAICPLAFAKRYQNDYMAAGATGYEAKASNTT